MKNRILLSGPIAIEAAASSGELKRFEMQVYSGGALRVPGYSLPIVIDLAGLTIQSQQRPVLRDHKPFKVIGHTDLIQIVDGNSVIAAGVISGTGPDAREVLATSKNGFQWSCSIGAHPEDGAIELVGDGETVQINGQSFTGPLYVARRSALREISFVPIGADMTASVVVAASGGVSMTFEQWLLGMEYTLEEISAMSEEVKAALMRVYEYENATEDPATEDTTDATPPPDAVPPPADPMAASARPAIQANGVASIRAQAAGELRRIAAINAACRNHADLTATVNGKKVNLQAHAIEAGWTSERTELEVLRASRSVSPHIHIPAGKKPATAAVIEAAVAAHVGLPNIEKHYKPEVLEQSRSHFRRGLGLQQLMIMAAAQNGYQPSPGERVTMSNLKTVLHAAFSSGPAIQAGWTPLSLPGIMSNVANKELLEGYMEEDQTWREIAAIKPVSDFKQVTSYRLLDNLEYEQVGAGGEIKHGTLGEESYTRQADTYARMLTLTRKDIINDDLGALDDLRTRLGRGAAQKFNKLFWTEFLSDASTFWTTGRTNYITGATTNLGTDGVGLGLGVKAFRQMTTPTDDGSKRIGGTPELLVVPPELETIAQQLYVNQNLGSGTTVANANIFANKYKPVVSVYLSDSSYTGYSTTAWYLLRNPGIAPAVVVSFLNGVQTPTVEEAEADFSVLGVQFRGYHDFGCDQAEYLCGIKSKGAA